MEANETRRRQARLVLLLAGGGVIAALAALPWHTYAISVPGAGSFRFDRSGLQSPEEGLGQLALVVAALLVLAVGFVLVKGGAQPDLGPRVDPLLVVLGLAVVVLVGLKLVLNTDFLGTGAWTSVVLGIVIAWGGLSLRRRGG